MGKRLITLALLLVFSVVAAGCPCPPPPPPPPQPEPVPDAPLPPPPPPLVEVLHISGGISVYRVTVTVTDPATGAQSTHTVYVTREGERVSIVTR
jgi:hypothetical protein